MISKEEFQKIINYFTAMNLPWTPNFKEREISEVWYNEFKHLEVDDFRIIARQMKAKVWERFPQMAEMYQMLHGDLSQMTSLAWEKVMMLMRNTYQPIAIDEITARALTEILSCRNIHEAEGWNIDEIQWRRKEFEESFKTSYQMHLAGKFTENHELPRLSGARSGVPIFRVSKEQLKEAKFLFETPPANQIPSETGLESPEIAAMLKDAIEAVEKPKTQQRSNESVLDKKEKTPLWQAREWLEEFKKDQESLKQKSQT